MPSGGDFQLTVRPKFSVVRTAPPCKGSDHDGTLGVSCGSLFYRRSSVSVFENLMMK